VLSVGAALGATLPEEVAAPEAVADAEPVGTAAEVPVGDGGSPPAAPPVGSPVAVGAIEQLDVGESDAVGPVDRVAVAVAVGLADTVDWVGWGLSDGAGLDDAAVSDGAGLEGAGLDEAGVVVTPAVGGAAEVAGLGGLLLTVGPAVAGVPEPAPTLPAGRCGGVDRSGGRAAVTSMITGI
jgi:hypothetical protein